MSRLPKIAGRTPEALTYGLLCAPVGVAIGLYVSLNGNSEALRYLPAYAGLSAILTAALFWWLLIQRPGKRTRGRAAMVGVLTGLLAHWLCWYLMLLWANVEFWLLGGSGSSLGEAPMEPLSGLIGVLAYCFWSWLLFGWITIAAALGLALFRVRRTNNEPAPRNS